MRCESFAGIILLLSLLTFGCGRDPEIVYVRAAPKRLSYVLNPETNTIEGIMIVPVNLMLENELVPVMALPGRLYEKKTAHWGRILLYDFVEKLTMLYDFPIEWDPEPDESMKQDPVFSMPADGLDDGDFFQLLAAAVAFGQEMGFQPSSGKGSTHDPNKICVAIITKDRAVIKIVKTLTGFYPRVGER